MLERISQGVKMKFLAQTGAPFMARITLTDRVRRKVLFPAMFAPVMIIMRGDPEKPNERFDRFKAQESDRLGRIGDLSREAKVSGIKHPEHFGGHRQIPGDDLANLIGRSVDRVQLAHDFEIERRQSWERAYSPDQFLKLAIAQPDIQRLGALDGGL